MSRVYCDLDGTLITGDIEREFIRYLQSIKHFSVLNYFLAAISVPVNTMRRKQVRGSKYKSWTVGCTEEERGRLYSEFLDGNPEKIRFRPEVLEKLKELKESNCEIILMTGSFRELVLSFLEKENVIDLFDEIIACEVAKDGFRVTQHPYGKDKCLFLKKDKPLVGIANEYADHYYLEMCSEAYVVGADEELKRIADEKKWRCL